MAERRKLSDAIKLSPETVAFIEGRAKPEPAQVKVLEKPVTLAANPTTHPREAVDLGESTQQRPTERQHRRKGRSASDSDELLDQVLVPVTIRVPRRIAQSLRRAYLEQRLNSLKPGTQQEIVQEALTDWLNRNGY